MKRPTLFIAFAMLVAVALLAPVTATPAGPTTGGRSYQYRVGGPSGVYRAPAYVYPAYPASPLFAVDFAPRLAVSGGEEEQELSAPATMTATVPANAEIWVDGKKTKQDGTVRLFITPPLTRGSTYAYEVRVHWTAADGTIVDLTRNVTVRAGLETRINIAAP